MDNENGKVHRKAKAPVHAWIFVCVLRGNLLEWVWAEFTKSCARPDRAQPLLFRLFESPTPANGKAVWGVSYTRGEIAKIYGFWMIFVESGNFEEFWHVSEF